MVRLLPLLFLLLAALAPARASDQPSVVTAVRQSTEGNGARVEIDVLGDAVPRLVLLRKPYRIALDLDGAVSAAKLPDASGALVASLRQGLAGADRYRLLVSLKEAVEPRWEARKTDDRITYVLDLRPGRDADFAWTDPAPAPVRESGKAAPVSPHRFTVVIDPGHGGVDRGATGEGGTEEKAVNLAFALSLRDALAKYPEIQTILTREDDTFIPLNERSAVARRARADLFLSLHSDSIRYKELRGATVYTLSDRASDSLSSEIAESENAADRFAGPEWDQDAPEIHDILVDLVRRETESFTRRFVDELVRDLKGGGVRLINNPKRSAGFRVLRAPDVPSVLLEIGYLSNREDEALLASADWQRTFGQMLADAIVGSLRSRGG